MAGSNDGGFPGVPYSYILVGINISAPATNAMLGSSVQVTGTASCTQVNVAADGSESSSSAIDAITKVEVRFGSGSYLQASKQGGTWASWSRSKSLSVSGPMTITARVTATDTDGGTVTLTDSVTVQVDVTAPSLSIDSPLEGTTYTWVGGGVGVTVAGTASDALSGLSTVEWDLNGQNQYSPVNLGAGTWNTAVTLPSAGEHTITVRARDQKGNETVRSVHLNVAVTFDPADPENVVSLASYLGDLLDYAGVRAKSSSSGPTLSRQLLADTFHQPFDELTDPALASVTDEAVPQVRVAIEVLRRYFTSEGLTVPAAAESSFLWAAYLAVLRRLGTSYDEVRLARVADAETRAALAERLGIALAPARPDHLDELVLDPGQIGEDDLENLFGLRKTSQDPFTAGVVPEAQLLTWQRTRLRSLWQQLDANAGPILDPDVVAPADLRDATPASPAFSLLDARAQWVEGRLAFHKGVREAEATPLAGFDAVVSGVLGPVPDLLTLYAQHNEGEDVRPQLATQPIPLAAFLYLLRIRELAESGTVLDSEWEDVYSILTAVEKERQDETWKSEEAAVGLVLGPDEFVVSDASPALPRWRASAGDRRDWLSRLASRFEQEETVTDGLRSAVTSAEEETLPALRDAMVQAARPALDPQEAADELTLELAVDMGTSGTEKATRLSQGIATLQSVLFSLRTGRYIVPHPTAAWVLDLSTNYTESDFDQEWRWMGSYSTWRAAMLVFGYPESYLLPNLREHHLPNQEPSQAYAALVKRLRETPRLNPAQARAEAAAYLAELRAEVTLPSQLQDPFAITDELTEAQLAERRTLVQTLFGAVTDPHLAPNHLKEVFYFVPMLLARHLQQVRQFLAALDWYQTVYAYNLKVSDRKIYRGLVLEESITTQYQRTLDWLLEGLNPHDIVVVRANAYTRFTLLCLVRCFLEYANSEFTRDTAESIPRARALYVTALDLLDLPEMQHDEDSPFPANPVLGSLRLNAELNLFKLRSGRNFAGMKRQGALTVPRSVSISALPTIGNGGRPVVPEALTFHPTAYRYSALIERAKQLVSIAQQVESVYLAALEKFDAESYNLLKARQDLQLSRAGVRLQELRLDTANDGVRLAELQRTRAELESDHYQGLLDEGLIGLEKSALGFMVASAALQTTAAALTATGGFLNIASSIVAGRFGDPAKDAAQVASLLAGAASTTGSIFQTMASYERRKEEWRHQLELAQHGLATADAQIAIAQDQVLVTGQEHLIAEMQAGSAEDTVEFLVNKFTSAELYEWMSGVLGQVYSYFLQQATAVAELAQHQLAFERQEHPPSYIQADYWQLPSENGAAAPDESAPDRRGLTGATRLLQDIYQLDQHAFETNQRKLQLTQTFSLAQLAPAEFQRFRETGVLPFSLPMELFDRDFPGHYLRLVQRVRTSVVALIPPTRGIRATLAASGLSRVVVGKTTKQTITVRRDPEVVALTSPIDATGLFELRGEDGMLLPFEGMGVDTSWELRLPKASNPFDYNSLADVLFTVEYTALHSGDYEQQVVSGLSRGLRADRPYSFRHQFADAWFDLHNPEQSATPMTVSFETRREDFPPNVEDLKVRHVMLYVSRSNGTPFEVTLDHLHFTPEGEAGVLGGSATTVDGAVSTRRTNGSNWFAMTEDKSVVGTWELALPDTEEMKGRFRNEEIDDLLLVVSYQGETPAWPA